MNIIKSFIILSVLALCACATDDIQTGNTKTITFAKNSVMCKLVPNTDKNTCMYQGKMYSYQSLLIAASGDSKPEMYAITIIEDGRVVLTWKAKQ